MIKVLIEGGADVNFRNGFPLMTMVNKSLFPTKYLVGKGADITIHNNRAMFLTAKENRFDIVLYIVDQGANINARKGIVLNYAAHYRNVEAIRALVKRGAQTKRVCIDEVLAKLRD